MDITPEEFNALLNWLDDERERAGAKYEEIRRVLIRIFTCRGCREADRLADDTINRVIKKVPLIAPTYEGNPALYFYAVAQNVMLEYWRHEQPTTALPLDAAIAKPEEEGIEYACLDACAAQLPSEDRELIMDYYSAQGSAAEHRRRLAERLGIAINALRIRVHRIRASLQACVLLCVERQSGG